MFTQPSLQDIRLPPAEMRPDMAPERVEKTRLERYGVLITTIIVMLLSQSLESFISRQVGVGVMGKLTYLFTALAVLFAIVPAIVLRPRSFLFTIWVNLPFQMYTLVSILSVFWSMSKFNTLEASITLLCFHGTGVALASMFSWRTIWKGIAWGIMLLSLLSVLIIPYDGLMTEVHPGALRGLWREKNASAESFAICAIACSIIAIADRNPKYFAGTIAMLGLIVMAQAAGALAACMAGLSFLYFFESIRRGPVRFFVGSWLATIMVLLVVFVIAGLGLEAAGLLGRDTNLTGRTEIWPTIIRFIQDRPLLGYGFQAFWVDGMDTKKAVMIAADFEAHNAHNSYLEMMLGIGAVGSFFVWLGIGRSIFQASTALFGGQDARRFTLAFMVFGLLLSMSESMLGDSAGMAAFVLGILVPKIALSYAIAKGHYKP